MSEKVDTVSSSLNQTWNKSVFKISKLSLFDDFSLHFYSEWEEVFVHEFNQRLLINRIKKYQASNLNNFREQVVFSGITLMVNYFFAENIIRISYPSLNEELFIINKMNTLIKETRSSLIEIKELEHEDSFCLFKKHITKIASMEASSFPSVYDLTVIKYKLCDFEDKQFQKIDKNSELLTSELLKKIKEYKPNLFERFTDFGLQQTAIFALLRIHQLKFIAILPSLDGDLTGVEVKRVLLESLRRLIDDSQTSSINKTQGEMRALPSSYILIVKILFFLASIVPSRILAQSVRGTIRFMAKRFIAGESIETAKNSLSNIYQSGRDVTLDQLGELVVSEKEALNYQNEVLNLINGYALHVTKGSKNKANILRAHISIKLSALCNDFIPEAFEYTYNLVAPKLVKILLAAKDANVFINIDAEHYNYREIIFSIYKKTLLETPALHDFSGTGVVVQAYLRDAYFHLQDIIELAKIRKITMPIRLVKGAYWDAETVEADAHGHTAPEFLNKEETDLHFRQLIVEIFKGSPHIQLCLASHNFADHAFAESLRSHSYRDTPYIEHQCLHMTYEALSMGMTKMDWVVRNYVPIGSLIVGMAYLVRRIMENSSQVGVLTIMRSHNRALSFIPPYVIHNENKEKDTLVRDVKTRVLCDDFSNIPPLRLYKSDECQWVREALNEKKFISESITQKDETCVPLTGELQSVFSSSDQTVLVGKIYFASLEDTFKNISKSNESFLEGEWRRTPAVIRSFVLIKASTIMLAKRNKLVSLICFESGKSIVEALADVDEAIDFLTFYAREECRLTEEHKMLESRGVIAVISPWNFPLAIPCGMIASALVAGNNVILKSAEQTPLIAQELVNLLHLAGVPESSLIHLPGLGETTGDCLVNHKRVAGVIFTGSKFVGQLISKNVGSRIYYNEVTKTNYPVKVVTEMGGKNAIIVTANAELDETVSEIIYSSFGHAGQKCSACSRVIVHNSVKSRLLKRIKEACLDIEVGTSYNFETKINPVISLEDQKRLRNQAIEARLECKEYGGRVIVDRTAEVLPGLCVGPAVFEIPYSRALSVESYSRKELFGPILHIIGYDKLEQAIDLFNCTEYALTGGSFCQSEDDIEYINQRLESGNIYVNRSITGARVAVEPFGGFKLSGTGPKAGGRDYLLSMHINNHLNEIVNSLDGEKIVEEGNHYDFDLKSISKLTVVSRYTRFSKAMIQIIMSFENIYGGLEINKKKQLNDFHNWTKLNFINLMTKKNYNQTIPGQHSYNDYSQIKDKIVFFTSNDKADLNILFSVFSAICVGSGVTILCRNKQVFSWWSSIVLFFHNAGFSKENLDIYFCSEDLLKKALQSNDAKVLLLDLCNENLIKEYERIMNYIKDKPSTKCIKTVVTSMDAPSEYDYRSLLLQFINIRSFAVNIMRHGAKMDIEEASTIQN